MPSNTYSKDRTKQNYKKKVFMIYVALATKLQNYKKSIHVCLDVALMEGKSEKHPSTDAAYGSSLVDVTILIHFQNIPPNN